MEATTGSQRTNRIHACAYVQCSTVQPPAEISYRVRLRRLSLFINSRVMHACSCPPLLASWRIDAWHAMDKAPRRRGSPAGRGSSVRVRRPRGRRPACPAACAVRAFGLAVGTGTATACRCGPLSRSLPASRGARRGRTLSFDRSTFLACLHLRTRTRACMTLSYQLNISTIPELVHACSLGL